MNNYESNDATDTERLIV